VGELCQRTKQITKSDARKVFCYLGSKELEMPQSEIRRYLNISVPAVWAAAKQGKRVLEERGFNDII
jgi:hypothetical protein